MKKIIGVLLVFALIFSSCKKAEDKPLKRSNKEKINKTNGLKKIKSKETNGNEIEFSKKPEIGETTNEKIKLKYKFKKGVKKNIVELSKITIRYNGRLIFIDTYTYGYYKITEKLKDSYMLEWEINRLKIKMKMNVNGKEENVFYDSATGKESKMISSKVLKNMLNTVISAEVDSYGHFKDTDFRNLIKSIEESSLVSKVRKNILQKAKQFIENTHIVLPEKEVKEGDEYQGRKGVQDFSMIELKNSRKYKVKAVSKDKKFAVLKVFLDFETGKNNTKQKIEIKKKKSKGWILFNIEKGLLEESYLHTRLSMKVNDIEMKLDMKSNFKVLDK